MMRNDWEIVGNYQELWEFMENIWEIMGNYGKLWKMYGK